MPFSGDGHWMGSPMPSVPSALIIDDDNRKAIEFAQASIQGATPLVLYGPMGTGKTTILGHVAKQIPTHLRQIGVWNPACSTRTRHCWIEDPTTWTSAEAYVRDVKGGWGRKFDDPQEMYSPDGIAVQVPRLFLDDLGNEPNTESNRDEIVRLLTERYSRNLSTWISTNLEVDKLEERYGPRVLDRLRDKNAFVAVYGESRRGAS